MSSNLAIEDTSSDQLVFALGAVLQKDSFRPQDRRDIEAVASALKAEDVNSERHLEGTIKKARRLDAKAFWAKSAMEFTPFLVNTIAQHGLTRKVAVVAAQHGPHSAWSWVFALFCGVVLPAFLCPVMEAAAEGLVPAHTVRLPVYKGPSWERAANAPFWGFAGLTLVYPMLASLIGKMLLGFFDAPEALNWLDIPWTLLGAVAQILDQWNSIPENPTPDCLDPGRRPEHIRASVRAIKQGQLATETTNLGRLKKLPSSALCAPLHPSFWATAIVLLPGAALGYYGQLQEGSTVRKLTVDLMASVAIAGLAFKPLLVWGLGRVLKVRWYHWAVDQMQHCFASVVCGMFRAAKAACIAVGRAWEAA